MKTERSNPKVVAIIRHPMAYMLGPHTPEEVPQINTATTRIELHGAGSTAAYYQTGKDEPVALIYSSIQNETGEDKLIGMLTRDELQALLNLFPK